MRIIIQLRSGPYAIINSPGSFLPGNLTAGTLPIKQEMAKWQHLFRISRGNEFVRLLNVLY